LGLGPESWLAFETQSSGTLLDNLKDSLSGLAAIAEQSDAYVPLCISGPHVREMLSKLLPIDLHKSVFTLTHVGATLAAHMNVIVWRDEDRTDGAAVFIILVFRSFLGSFLHILQESAAEFGVTFFEPLTGGTRSKQSAA
jgi:sarcosine oxidase subunit gamma